MLVRILYGCDLRLGVALSLTWSRMDFSRQSIAVLNGKNEIGRIAPGDRVYLHCLRHSITVHLLESGDSLASIRAFLGHESFKGTLVYAEVTPELANKYLHGRDKSLPADDAEGTPKPNPIAFLKRGHGRKH
ncbi:MAG: tyrosine-type recombinase/integrase [Clostridiales bacterium]|jgi:site-specific recombinase XerD|nr:tyrosine-type recombinase/integrase [Clostridiales bacterium]